MNDTELKEKIRSYSIDIMNLLRKHYSKLNSNISSFTTGSKMNSDNEKLLKLQFEEFNFPYLYVRNNKRNSLFFNAKKDEKHFHFIFKEGNNIINILSDERINFEIDGIKFNFIPSYDSTYPLLKNKENIFQMLLNLKVNLEKIISLTKAADILNSTESNEKSIIKAMNVFKTNLSEPDLYYVISCIPTENMQVFIQHLLKEKTTTIDMDDLLLKSKSGWLSTIMLCSLHKDVIFTDRDAFKYYAIKEKELINILNPIVLHKNLTLTLAEKSKSKNDNFKI